MLSTARPSSRPQHRPQDSLQAQPGSGSSGFASALLQMTTRFCRADCLCPAELQSAGCNRIKYRLGLPSDATGLSESCNPDGAKCPSALALRNHVPLSRKELRTSQTLGLRMLMYTAACQWARSSSAISACLQGFRRPSIRLHCSGTYRICTERTTSSPGGRMSLTTTTRSFFLIRSRRLSKLRTHTTEGQITCSTTTGYVNM